MEFEFEWDEEKRLSNIEKHRIDFRRATEIFDGRPTLFRESSREGERRFVTVGILDDRHIAVVWTQRGDNIRIISARRARVDEAKHYHDTYGKPN